MLGEHAVVYGAPALAIPVKNLHIKTTISDLQQPGITIATADFFGPLTDLPARYNGISFIIDKMVHDFQLPLTFNVSYQSTIPLERGLGSSASVAFGTINALKNHFKLELSSAEILALTNQAETINHGSASGLDTLTVSSPSTIAFKNHQIIKTMTKRLGGYLVIADSQELGNTKVSVSQVRQQVESDQDKHQRLSDLGEIAEAGITAFEDQDAHKFGQLMNNAETILRQFQLETQKISKLIELAQANAALGAKLSGSGLGGIVISLAKSSADAELIKQAQTAITDQIWIEEI